MTFEIDLSKIELNKNIFPICKQSAKNNAITAAITDTWIAILLLFLRPKTLLIKEFDITKNLAENQCKNVIVKWV